jgi:SagB-type dehydrogenase family enzyme
VSDIDLLYQFNDDVLSVVRDCNRIILEVRNHKPIGFTVAAAPHADAIEELIGEGVTLRRLHEVAAMGDNRTAADRAVRFYLERFAFGRLLSWRLADGNGTLATVTALSARYRPALSQPPDGPLQLGRFAFLRSVDGKAVLESGSVRARVDLADRGLAALVPLLTAPTRVEQRSLAEALWSLGFLESVEAGESEAARCWEFHDLLMHELSRGNRDVGVVGASYRFEKKFPSATAVKQTMQGERITLTRVDPSAIRRTSRSLDEVQACRRSLRRYGADPLSLNRLGEFLWRVCRTIAHTESRRQDLISRPYPAGGSINELEFYVAVRRCSGLEPAVYHYDGHRHELIRLPESTRVAGKIVDRSATAMGLAAVEPRPDATIVIASRLPRLAWKYQGMAYRASLMNAGVVFHLMYMVATDMGLAPCANGTGDSRLLETVTGIDPFEETAIAEFALGMPGP